MFFHKKKNRFLKYSFIDNSILLKTETINKKGFYEVWRQTKSDGDTYSVQILCYNPTTFEFQAFDRFHWSDEPVFIGNGIGWSNKEDLWTPIKLHFTLEWLQEQLKQ